MIRLLPPVNRARGFHLYTQDGRRFIDLWQSGGGALLGHNSPNVLRELKNAANRGLVAPLPHVRENRLIKAIGKLFPDKTIRLFADEASLRRALSTMNVPGARDPFFDPALNEFPEKDPPAISLWRPFLPERFLPQLSAPFLVPVLPWPLSPGVLVFAKEPETENKFVQDANAAQDMLSPVIIAAAARSVHDLIAAPERGKVNYLKIKKTLAYDKCIWQQRGIYLSLKSPPDSYAELFSIFLEGGFLLPPDLHQPLILPGELSPGEESNLAELLSVVGV
ncbi:hypothetical protein AGMMS49928_21520 [Spirochaetia bacterium]|nr:hypothetical protein AGMMS49928_21520 [Spirochaetia bacterium]